MDANGEVIDKQRISNDDISRYLQEQVLKETYAVLEEWERIYNQVRPHHSPDNLTPKEYIQSNYPKCIVCPGHRTGKC
ncbi:MAG: transposase [Anaerolineaceae bacterium]|nr:transposase [Anaerolineaceae bacterium]